MNKLLSNTLLMAGLGAASASAEWSVVTTFDSEADIDTYVTDVTNVESSGAMSAWVDGKWATYHGDLFESTSNLFANLDLGVDLRMASINAGGPVTVYFEITQPTVSDGAGGTRKAIVDTVWGLSNVQPAEVLETTYNSYNLMQRINSGTGSFEGRNGGDYEVVGPFTADVSYSIWLVVDYTLNYYEAYIQGGDWSAQTKLPSTTDDIWFFRNNPGTDVVVDQFLVALSAGNIETPKGLDVTYFDNFAVDASAQNLTNPFGSEAGPGVFAEFSMDAESNVDTGEWLGWIYTEYYPWVYVYSETKYIYMHDAADASAGAWAYLPR